MPPKRGQINRAKFRAGAATAAVQVEGLERLGTLMRAAPKELEQAFRRDLKDIARPVALTAQALIQAGTSGTGTLAASIKVRSSTRGRRVGARVGSNLVYAPVREFGRKRTLRIPGRAPARQTLTPGRFIMRAIDAHRTNILRKAEALTARTLDRVFAAAGVERFI